LKKQYPRGKFGNEPTKEAALTDRVEQLKRLVGELTLEKELLRKALLGIIHWTTANVNKNKPVQTTCEIFSYVFLRFCLAT